MTLVTIWRETDVDRIWMVSDSRLSNAGQAGGRIQLTDHAAKILEATLVLRSSLPNAPHIQTSNLGFAYTGSSLVAIQAYSAVLPLWSRLQSSERQMLPTIQACAEHLSKFVVVYAGELAASGLDGGCKCLLAGYDYQLASLDVWIIETVLDEMGMVVNVERLELSPGTIKIFGSGKAEAEEALAKYRPLGRGWNREPLEMIRQHLPQSTIGDVGGGVQIGVVSQEGFEVTFDVQNFRAGMSLGNPLSNWKYRGLPFEEISRIGHAFTSLRGIGS